MRDLKIKPGMDTPKAKLKNPAPKDADSLLKQHMDKRQREKEPESRDPVRYATDRVEKNMRRGASGAADASRRMILGDMLTVIPPMIRFAPLIPGCAKDWNSIL